MTLDLIILATAIFGLLGGIVALWREVKGLRREVNGRLDALLKQAHAEGVEEERDRASGRD